MFVSIEPIESPLRELVAAAAAAAAISSALINDHTGIAMISYGENSYVQFSLLLVDD